MFARITLDTSDYESGLDEASKNTSNFADKLKTGLATAAKVGAAALTAAATGVAALTKASIDQYAEYEQLIGGVDTLFKDASDTIQEYAANAYKTAGVSANTYMQQATAFSASLIQSLGGDTEAAAEYANQAIMDMSDNANKMGTDIESIQQTYQSLMRGNYAMLDNLKLGYGGTKSELERLVADAEKLTGQALDPAKFSDVITAIHAVQENLGITGTTAEEAATTIEGSVGMMKAAWSNLLTGIADENADPDKLINQFVESVGTAAENIVPRIMQTLSGLGAAVMELAPEIISNGAEIVNSLTSGVVQAIPVFISGIGQTISQALNFITENLPAILEKGVEFLNGFVNGILSYIPQMVSQLPQIISAFIEFVAENLPTIIDAGINLLLNFVSGIIQTIPQLISQIPQIISAFTDGIANNLPKIIQAGFNLLLKLIDGILSAIPDLVASLPQIINAIIDGIRALMGGIVNIGKSIVQGIWQGIQSMVSWITEKVTGFFSGIVDSVKGLLGIHSPSTVFSEMGKNMALGLGEGWDNEYDRIRRNIEGGLDFGTANVDFASSGLGVASAGMVNGISSAFQDTSGGTITVNLMMPDGTKFASYLLGPLSNYAKANGTPILNPT